MSDWLEAPAPAKLNLALVVGPRRTDGRHEVVTVLERLSLADSVAVRRSATTRVTGFEADTLVANALDRLARSAQGEPRFEARIVKRIPVAAGLGGGSSDAATALRLANGLLEQPLGDDVLSSLAAALGADVPFFLRDGPQLATGDGTTVAPLALPTDYVVLLALPKGAAKESTRAVYEAFDERGGERGFEQRKTRLEQALPRLQHAADLALLPPNDLVSSPLADELRAHVAFRADVTGAGPVVYGLFADPRAAARAAAGLEGRARTWITAPS